MYLVASPQVSDATDDYTIYNNINTLLRAYQMITVHSRCVLPSAAPTQRERGSLERSVNFLSTYARTYVSCENNLYISEYVLRKKIKSEDLLNYIK